MLTMRSRSSGPAASNRCLPIAMAIPPTSATSTMMVRMALPIDDDRMAGALRGARRLGQPLGLKGGARTARRDARSASSGTGRSVRARSLGRPGPRVGRIHRHVSSSPREVRRKYGERVDRVDPLHSVCDTAKDQRCIGPAKAERIRQNHIDIAFASLVWNEIERRIDRRVVKVNRRRCNLVANCEHREDRFDRPGGAEQMTDRRLGRRHGDASRRHFPRRARPP